MFLNDFCVYGNRETHSWNLKWVLDRLVMANASLNPKKCQFGLTKEILFGHIVLEDGICTNFTKIEESPISQNKKIVVNIFGTHELLPKVHQGLCDSSISSHNFFQTWDGDCGKGQGDWSIWKIEGIVLKHLDFNGTKMVLNQLYVDVSNIVVVTFSKLADKNKIIPFVTWVDNSFPLNKITLSPNRKP